MKKSDRESTEESAKKSVKSRYDGEYDLASSNKKMRMQAEEIEKMSEKITKGFNPCGNLSVTCIIRNQTNNKKKQSQSPVNLTLQRKSNSQTR